MNDMMSLQDIVDEVDSRRERLPGMRRIAVAGEFESGKTSVLNALLGRVAVPCNPGLPGRPLIRVTHSPYPMIFAEDRSGRSFESPSVAALSGIEQLSACDIHIPAPHLARTEVIEVPHHPGSGIDAEDFAMMAEADMIVWVTIASQAWRLSEQAIVGALPPEARERSVLAISRADHLNGEADWEKVETRLQNEAAPYFSEMVFMQASLRNIMAADDDEAAWIATGGPTLTSIADDMFADRQGAAA